MVQPSPLSDYHMRARHDALMAQAEHARLVRDARAARRAAQSGRRPWSAIVTFASAAFRRTEPRPVERSVDHQPVKPAAVPLS